METVAGPGPAVREASWPKRLGLVPWIALCCYTGNAVGNILIAFIALQSAGHGVGWPKWAWIAVLGIILIIGIVLQPGAIRDDLRQFRQRFPDQSMSNGRWLTLPFLRWWPLYGVSYAVSVTLGLIVGTINGTVAWFLGGIG